MALDDLFNLAAAVFPTADVRGDDLLILDGGYTWVLSAHSGALHPLDIETQEAGAEVIPSRFFSYKVREARAASRTPARLGDRYFVPNDPCGREFYRACMRVSDSDTRTKEHYAERLSNQARLRAELARLTGTSAEDWMLRNTSDDRLVYRAANARSNDSELTVEFDWFYTKPSKTSILLDARLSTGPDFEECLRYARRLRDMALLIERTLNPEED